MTFSNDNKPDIARLQAPDTAESRIPGKDLIKLESALGELERQLQRLHGQIGVLLEQHRVLIRERDALALLVNKTLVNLPDDSLRQ